jgi:hypothetical protein
MLEKRMECVFCKSLYDDKTASPIDGLCKRCYGLVRECTQGGLKMRDG